MATFNDFCDMKFCKGYKSSSTAKMIFDFLNANKQLMINATQKGLPALEGVIVPLESYYSTISNPDFDYDISRNKRNIGRMVKIIMLDEGYSVYSRQKFQNGLNTKIKSATVYK